jgi:uncharacterized glyoxalase superfamily protein PhnB
MMRIFVAFWLGILLFSDQTFAQDPKAGLVLGKKILNLINQNKAAELAKFVNYPLQRPNPIPDIKNAKEFVAYYPNLFDAKFKKLVPKFNQKEVFVKNGLYGMVGDVFHGEIWYDESGIVSINYFSEKEMSLEKSLTKMIQSVIHPSVNQWESNVFVGKSKNLLVRVDRLQNGDLRYASWSKGKPIGQKPDLVILKGEEVHEGTMGSTFWTFTNNNWKYTILNQEACENCDHDSFELVLEENGVEKSRVVLTLSK